MSLSEVAWVTFSDSDSATNGVRKGVVKKTLEHDILQKLYYYLHKGD